jgi:hypothetical protein
MNEGEVIGGEAPREVIVWIRRPSTRDVVKSISEKLAHDLNNTVNPF